MTRPGIAFEDVERAAKILIKKKKPITTLNVREVLGTGSNSTISRHIHSLKGSKPAQGGEIASLRIRIAWLETTVKELAKNVKMLDKLIDSICG
jgi:Plasmid replication region DNA-binding N-term